MIFDSIAKLAGGVLDKVIIDKNARASAEVKLQELVLNGELAQMSGQLEINKAEAQHPSIFVAGARPGLIWLCGLILLNQYIVYPYAVAFGIQAVSLDDQAIMPIIMGLMGLGGARTYEKIKGVHRDNLNK